MNGLSLNLVEVQLNQSKIKVFVTLYSDGLWESCQEEDKDYRFLRLGREIYAWPINNTHEPLPSDFALTEVSMDQKPRLFASILEQSIVDFFKCSAYEVESVKYSSTWSVRLRATISGNSINFQGLQLSPFLDFSFHTYWSKVSKKPVVGISIIKRLKPEFVYTEEEFSKNAIDTRDWPRGDEGQILPIKANFDSYLKSSGQDTDYYKTMTDFYSDEKNYPNIIQLYKSFVAIKDRLFLPDGLKVEDLSLKNLPNQHFEQELIKKPIYYYYSQRTKIGAFYDAALEELRPASYERFAQRLIKIIILTPKEHEGSAGSFSKRLETKLKNIFYLVNIQISVQAFDKTITYPDAIDQTDLKEIDLVVIVVSEKDKIIDVSSSPYYITKAKLLNQRIPSQDVTIENVKLQNPFIEKNIALNIYSKIGGIAWTIEKDEKDKKELIIGVGTTVDWEKNRRIGFANVFDYNGTYLLGDCSQISTKENYTQNLEQHLKKSIHEILNRKSIDPNVPFRLIFHLRKEAGYKTEIEAIENALKQFPDYQFQYALLHLSDNHNFRFYNNEGRYRVERGTFVQLSQEEALLHLGGNGTIPILIKVDYRSTYKDIFALSQQVLFFSHLSQRSFKPANEPVTTKYPSIMAKLTSDLSRLSNWDISQLDKLKDKLWFI